MNQVSDSIENSINWDDNNKSNSDDINLFFNENISIYPSLLGVPLQSSLNNIQFNSQINDQYYQTEKQCFYNSEYTKRSNLLCDKSQDTQHHHHKQTNSNDYQQTNNIDLDFFKPMSLQQDSLFIENQQQEVIYKEEFESNNYQESERDDNLSITNSSQQNNLSNNFVNQINKNSSQINIKFEENTQFIKQKVISQNITCKNNIKKIPSQRSSDKNLEKSKQSISKNNIRNFLTPIVRMRSKFIDYTLLEREKVTPKDFDSFLKQHFYIPGESKLKIRQAKFDSLLSTLDNTQMKEKRVFAQIVIKNIQNLFMNLIIEKKSTFNNQQFHQQFEWINGINESLLIFLNSTQREN